MPTEDGDEDVEDYQLYWRPLRSNEIRKRYFLKVAKEYNLQEFFADNENDAKLKAAVEAEFMFGEKRKGEEAEETCNIRW